MSDAPVAPRPSEPVELAPSETAGQQVALTGMSRPRSNLLRVMKTSGETTAESLAAELGLTVAAVRQQLATLQEEGLVAYRDERSGRGRPRRWYCLTPAAETFFPKRYGQLANQLLGFIEEADPRLVGDAFQRRAEQRRARAETRLGGLDFDAAVVELAAILDEDGYLARAGEGVRWLLAHSRAQLRHSRRRPSARLGVCHRVGVHPLGTAGGVGGASLPSPVGGSLLRLRDPARIPPGRSAALALSGPDSTASMKRAPDIAITNQWRSPNSFRAASRHSKAFEVLAREAKLQVFEVAATGLELPPIFREADVIRLG